MSAHRWTESSLGHGERMCERCGITNREAAVLGLLNECEAEPSRHLPELENATVGDLYGQPKPDCLECHGIGWVNTTPTSGHGCLSCYPQIMKR